MKKRAALRRLRATIGKQQIWAIRPEAFHELLEFSRAGRVRASFTTDDEAPKRLQLVGGTAVIPVVGILQSTENYITRWYGGTSTQTVERMIQQTIADDKVKSIALWFDTPGGTALGNQELWQAIRAYREKKPIAAFVRGQCCSAGLYLASACHPIVATPSSMIGSVGCIATFIEYADMLQEAGIGVNVITHGENKGAGNPYEKMSPKHRATLQKMVTDYGTQFDQAVAEGRGVTVAEVRAKYGQGAVFIAEEAKTLGMIDAVGDWDALLTQISGSTQTAAVEDRQPSENASSAGGVAAKPGTTGASEPSTRENSMNKRLIAALVARGLLATFEPSQGEYDAALNAFFAGRGGSRPESIDDQVAAIMASAAVTPPSAHTIATAPAGGGSGAAPTGQQPSQQEIEAARQAGARAELERVQQLTARGRLLGVSQEQIDAAIASPAPAAQILEQWVDAKAMSEQPVSPAGSVNVGQEGIQRYVADAVSAIRMRMGGAIAERVTPAERSNDVLRLSRAPLLTHAIQCLRAANQRVDEYAPAEEIMEQAFQMDGLSRETIRAEGGAVNRPGSFPNLLSNLANKLLDDAIPLANTSYAEWTGVWAGDLPDFKPATVVAKSEVDELDEILDDEASKEVGLAEELVSMMVLSRYSNMFRLTPTMAANDDLQAFSEGLIGLGTAWENTVNRLCLRLLTGNVLLLDGFNLFDDTNHHNDITSAGGGPDDDQWEAMELKIASMTGVGGNGYVDTPLSVALVPPKWKRKGRQTFLIGLPESKQATTDDNINVYRGDVKLVVEPQLQAASSVKWYGLVDPKFRAAVMRAYFRGWGRNGRRQRWYDPATKSVNFELEGRVGAAVRNWRYIVRNKGES